MRPGKMGEVYSLFDEFDTLVTSLNEDTHQCP